MASWLKSEVGIREGAIRIVEQGLSYKYLITNKSDIKIGTMNIKSTNECRWILNLREIRQRSYVFELFTLENLITATNNPMVKDVAGFNNLFKEIYNELILDINFDGELLSVMNPSLIRNKWQRVKEDMKRMEIQQPSVAGMIRLNDNIFESDQNLFNVIKANEFFELFFIGFYGKVLPGHKNTKRANKFKGNMLDWKYRFSFADHYLQVPEKETVDIKMTGEISQHFSKKELEDTYGKFEFLDYKNVKPQISCNGLYNLNKLNGMIEKAVYNNYEIIDENMLYSKNEYSIERYI